MGLVVMHACAAFCLAALLRLARPQKGVVIRRQARQWILAALRRQLTMVVVTLRGMGLPVS